VTGAIVVDTGPLVAFCNARDGMHEWTLRSFAAIDDTMLTCEAVISEACFLLKRAGGDADTVFEMMERGALRLRFDLTAELSRVRQLMRRYADLPMSLADACLVRMAELTPAARVMTLDRDFMVYRRNGRQSIPLVAPFQ
jgi:predicted nucleic acid-binding protein